MALWAFSAHPWHLLTLVPWKDLKQLVVTGLRLGDVVLLQGSLNHAGRLILAGELGKEAGSE